MMNQIDCTLETVTPTPIDEHHHRTNMLRLKFTGTVADGTEGVLGALRKCLEDGELDKAPRGLRGSHGADSDLRIVVQLPENDEHEINLVEVQPIKAEVIADGDKAPRFSFQCEYAWQEKDLIDVVRHARMRCIVTLTPKQLELEGAS